MIGDINPDELCLYQLYRTAVHVEDLHHETSLDVSYSVNLLALALLLLIESYPSYKIYLRIQEMGAGCIVSISKSAAHGFVIF